MAKLYWLKSMQPCKLELHPLKDYAGQPLVFTPPGTGFSRRCVTEDVRNSPIVERYIVQQVIGDDDSRKPVQAPVGVLAAKPVKAVAPPAPPPPAPPAPEPVVVKEEPVVPVQVEELAVSVEVEDAAAPESATGDSVIEEPTLSTYSSQTSYRRKDRRR